MTKTAAWKARRDAEVKERWESHRRHLRLGFPPETVVKVRRHWNDCGIGDVRLDSLMDLHWGFLSGGIESASPHAMIYGYMWCSDLVAGYVSHSCRHGPGPHRIKIVLVKKDNDPKLMAALRRYCGPQPGTKAAA